jgi:uncharacterized protein (DUF2236 family)
MQVSREDWLRSLERARAHVADESAGIHGPGSISWRVNREAVLFLGGGRASLLQLAHPFVAHAVDQHSDTRSDVQGRFQRTFMNVYAMAFGDLEAALRSARRVHNIHARVRGEITEDVGPFARGTPYVANDAEALLWVHATLVDTAVQVFELTVRPLSGPERQRYLDESRVFAWLFGIPDEILWSTWKDFQRYMDDMHGKGVLTVGAPARAMAEFLMRPPTPALRPLTDWYGIVTAALLPERLREQFGMRFGRFERAVFGSSVRLLRSAYRRAPRRLRYVPAYVEATRRISGHPGPDRFGRLLERIAIRTLGGSFGGSEGEAEAVRGGCPVPH